MRPIYLYANTSGVLRKIAVDMAYLFAHKKIRLPKYYFEDSLHFIYSDSKSSNKTEQYFLTKDKVVKEDNDFFYFDFPVKLNQVIGISI
ncbi:MAG: hypothetical protein ROY99_13065 [Ignavibacterium sp.]|jgi:hypothetical protein|nr:hypothetical protein [Ignavibacterium sp.]